MSELAMGLNLAFVALNTVFLAALVVLYARMLGEMPSRFTWGLLVFGAVLLIQNAVQLYFFLTMRMYYAGGVEWLVLVQNGLATAALAFLAWVTFYPEGRGKPADAPS